MKYNHAIDAVSSIKSGDAVFIHSAAATPKLLVDALAQRAGSINKVKLYSIHTEWEATYLRPEYASSFEVNTFFVGSNVRSAVNDGKANYIPMFLSEIPSAFRNKVIPIQVALITLSPPDENGYCTLGVSCDVTRAAIEMADVVIAEINHNMPTINGDGIVNIRDIDAYIEVDYPIYTVNNPPLTEVELAIGGHVASLVEDGATIQMGIGGIPNAVLNCLHNHKDLGIHTEMFSDGILPLIEMGVINGKYKKTHPGAVVSSFVMGSRQLYDFLDKNIVVRLLDVGFVNNPANIKKNPKVTSINSAIEVDIFGQVCADSIGYYQYSGVGGQVDFMRGAALSRGGKPIIAIPSRTSKGISRIVSSLKPGASVTTTRAHVHYLVTEYGIASLQGKNLRERNKAIINIAHPDDQEQLERDAFKFIKTHVN